MSEKKLLPRDEWLQTRPRKRMASACLLQTEEGRYLAVKPNYRDHWQLPGGGMEEMESPLQNVRRELKEEIGLDITPLRLLVVDYRAEPGAVAAYQEKVDFLFHAPLSQEQVKLIRLQADELERYSLIMPGDFSACFSYWQAKRVHLALRALSEGRTIYAEAGVELL